MAERRRVLGAIFICVGLIVVLVAGFLTFQEYRQRSEVLARLEQTQTPASVAAAATATRIPTEPPTLLPTLVSTSTETSSVETTATPAATPAPTELPGATLSATPTVAPSTPTAAPPTPSPLPTATITPTPTLVPAPIVRLLSPAIELDTPIVDVGWTLVEENGQMKSVWETASHAAGHHINSALPGQGSNIVISGHHNIEGEVFRHIVDLEAGDEIVLEDELGRRFAYRVIETIILPEAGVSEEQRRENAHYIAQTEDERLTLVTCWPYWTNTHRVIVIARPRPS